MTRTLTLRGAWTRYEKLLASDVLAAASPDRVAESVRATCVAARGTPVYEVDEGDYWSQMGDDRQAAYDMADSVNGAVAYDRDRAVDAVVAIPSGSDSVTYLRAIAACLEQQASGQGEYTARCLSGLLGDVVRSVRASIEPGASS